MEKNVVKTRGEIKNEQSTDTDNFGHTRHKTRTNKKNHTHSQKKYKHGPHQKIGCEPKYSYTLLYRHHSEVLHFSLCKYSSKLCFNGLLLSGYTELSP